MRKTSRFFKEEDGMETVEWVIILGVVAIAIGAVAYILPKFNSVATTGKDKAGKGLDDMKAALDAAQ